MFQAIIQAQDSAKTETVLSSNRVADRARRVVHVEARKLARKVKGRVYCMCFGRATVFNQQDEITAELFIQWRDK